MSNSVRNCLGHACEKGTPHSLKRPSQKEQSAGAVTQGLKGVAQPKDKDV